MKGYRPMPTWDETPASLRLRWIMRYTRIGGYLSMVTDLIGAMGCYAARHRLRHRRWFTAFLWLCAFLFVVRIIAAIPEWPARAPFLFFIPPTLGAWLIFPLLLYEKLFPSLPQEAAETRPSESQAIE